MSTNLELISSGSILFNPGLLNTGGGTLRLTGADVQPLSAGVDARPVPK